MTKEEILAKRIVTFPEDEVMQDEPIKRNVYKAMQEYADYQSAEKDTQLKDLHQQLSSLKASMDISDGVKKIAEERKRQIEVEKWDVSHDEDYKLGELVGAAGCYAAHALSKHLEDYWHTNQSPLAKFQVYDKGELNFLVNDGDRGDRRIRKAGWVDGWPWDSKFDKRYKHDKVRALVIAGALIAAELDRLNPIPSQGEEIKK